MGDVSLMGDAHIMHHALSFLGGTISFLQPIIAVLCGLIAIWVRYLIRDLRLIDKKIDRKIDSLRSEIHIEIENLHSEMQQRVQIDTCKACRSEISKRIDSIVSMYTQTSDKRKHKQWTKKNQKQN